MILHEVEQLQIQQQCTCVHGHVTLSRKSVDMLREVLEVESKCLQKDQQDD